METDKIKTATFGLGWFWGPDAKFGCRQGVIRTRVGYAGGSKENPTYRSLGDHSETLQLDYDPTQVSFAEIVDMFWTSHNPNRRPWSRQYMSIIFYHDNEHKEMILKTKANLEESKGKVYTEIVPYNKFYPAEDYHQKYYLQRFPKLMQELRTIYHTFKDFVDSTLVARLNGYVTGLGSLDGMIKEIELSELNLEQQTIIKALLKDIT